MANIDKEEKSLKRGTIIKILLPILYLVVLIYLYYLLTEFGFNPLLITLILGFVFLSLLGLLFRKKKQKTLYSKMFPEKKKRRSEMDHQNKVVKIEEEFEKPFPENIKAISLDFKYRRSIINKCESCGITITSFVKRCPNCGTKVERKDIIKKCSNCGILITSFVKKCPVCGKLIV